MPFAILAAVAMVADWWAVWRGDRRVEGVAKPVATLALLLCAVVLDPASSSQRAWFVVALALCLAGDVLLYLDRFVPGLVAFLLGHLAYIVGFWTVPQELELLLVGAAIVALNISRLARPILAGAPAELRLPVMVYMGVIGVMTASAMGSGSLLAVIGAAVFMLSDSILAWNKFVLPLPWAPVAIMVTYHLAQAALVASLL